MYILSIDTSCDETAVAITSERKVITHLEYTQISTHKKWGGVVPSIAKRAHAERIEYAVSEVVERAGLSLKGFGIKDIDAVAVTVGPGLAIALEVGLSYAKLFASKHNKPLIPVNHMEGHIYSCFAQNRKGNPRREYEFPFLAFLISGGHTELVLVESHLKYKIIGKTLDDAAGEAIDKGARLIGLGYPGGAALERLARKSDMLDIYKFPRPMLHSGNLDFSFSGLKTSFLYFMKTLKVEEKIAKINNLASSYQEAVFDTLTRKADTAIKNTGVKLLVCGGGVAANMRLRFMLKQMMGKYSGKVYFPPYKYLTGDNAAMIGVVASYKAANGLYVKDANILDRAPRLSLENDIDLG